MTLEQATNELREAVEKQAALVERFNVTSTLLMNDGLADNERRAIRADFDALRADIRSLGEIIVRLRYVKADLKAKADKELFLSYRK